MMSEGRGYQVEKGESKTTRSMRSEGLDCLGEAVGVNERMVVSDG